MRSRSSSLGSIPLGFVVDVAAEVRDGVMRLSGDRRQEEVENEEEVEKEKGGGGERKVKLSGEKKGESEDELSSSSEGVSPTSSKRGGSGGGILDKMRGSRSPLMKTRSALEKRIRRSEGDDSVDKNNKPDEGADGGEEGGGGGKAKKKEKRKKRKRTHSWKRGDLEKKRILLGLKKERSNRKLRRSDSESSTDSQGTLSGEEGKIRKKEKGIGNGKGKGIKKHRKKKSDGGNESGSSRREKLDYKTRGDQGSPIELSIIPEEPVVVVEGVVGVAGVAAGSRPGFDDRRGSVMFYELMRLGAEKGLKQIIEEEPTILSTTTSTTTTTTATTLTPEVKEVERLWMEVGYTHGM